MEGVQLRGIFRRQIGGVKPVDGHGIQHPAKTADVIPVEMRGQSHIQMGHAQLPEKISRIDPLRPGIQLSRMIVPYQTVMAKIHHQGKLLLRSLHLPNENTVSVAYVDKVQSQHTQSSRRLIALTIPHLADVYNGKLFLGQPKFPCEF